MGVNCLPMTVTRQLRGCDLNPGHSVPESSTLTTRLPSHPNKIQYNRSSSSSSIKTAKNLSTNKSVMSLVPLILTRRCSTGQGTVISCGWEGNRRSGVALAMSQQTSVVYPRMGSWAKEER